MAKEIERKFLVIGEAWRTAACRQCRMVQGYLTATPTCTVRVRIAATQAFLTIKGPVSADGVSREEWEKEISVAEAEALLPLCRSGLIEKIRHYVPVGSHTFEVDEFFGLNRGLIVAEVELVAPDEPYSRPEWLGEEVTGQSRYYNAMLVRNPFTLWSK